MKTKPTCLNKNQVAAIMELAGELDLGCHVRTSKNNKKHIIDSITLLNVDASGNKIVIIKPEYQN